MRLEPGDPAPAISTQDFVGEPVDLEALRGHPVMVSFYRYATCPLCQVRVHELIGAHDRLSDLGLSMVAVFQSPAERIAENVGRHDAPFPIVGDPSMSLYDVYGVETSWRGLASVTATKTSMRALKLGIRPGRPDGPVNRLPADFLIAPDGTVAAARYGHDIDDHMPLDEIESWLRSIDLGDSTPPTN